MKYDNFISCWMAHDEGEYHIIVELRDRHYGEVLCHTTDLGHAHFIKSLIGKHIAREEMK